MIVGNNGNTDNQKKNASYLYPWVVKLKAIITVLIILLIAAMMYKWVDDGFGSWNMFVAWSHLGHHPMPIIIFLTRIGIDLSAIAFAVFLFMLFGGYRKCSIIGRIASMLATISALIGIVYVPRGITDSLVQSGWSFSFDITPTVWVYASLLLGITVFIILQKFRRIFDN